MHPDPTFHIDDPVIHTMLIEAVGFGVVIATTPSGLRVAHTPLASAGENAVRFHLAHDDALAGQLDGSTALLLVNGPEAYVSPRWYEDRGQIPTWNYVALELEGTVRALPPGNLAEFLGTVGARHEGRLGGSDSWRPEHVPPERWHEQFEAITGFEMTITERRATFKLSQDQSAEDRARVADALFEEGAPQLAQMMRGLDEPPEA